MKFPSVARNLTFVSIIALVAGCAADVSQQKSRSQVSSQIAAAEAAIDQKSAMLKHGSPTQRPSNIQVREGIYLGKEGFRTGRGDPLPRQFESEDGVTINIGNPIVLSELVQILQQTTGLRFDVRDLYAASVGGASPSASPISASSGGGDDSAGQGEIAATGGGAITSPNSLTHAKDIAFRVNHKGSLSSLLDYVAAQIGADWEYEGGRVNFLGPQTVTYTIWALPGQLTSTGSVGGAAFGSSTPPMTQVSRSYDYWGSIESGLATIVPETGSKYSVNKNAGTITVTGFQSTHDRVADFVQTENGRLSRQVSIKVDVIAFTSNDENVRSGSLTAALNKATAGYNVNFASAPTTVDTMSGLGMQILDTADSPFDSLAGTSGLVRALASQGRVSVLNSTSVVAMNDTPTPISIANEKAYLSGSVTEGEGDEATTTLTTDIATTGLNMVVTPRVLSGGEVMISYNMSINELKNLETYQTGESMIQMPETDTRNIMQTVNIDSGDTMVIASYDTSTTNRRAMGPFNPAFWGLGGSDGYTDDTTKIVIIMTPVTLEAQNSPIIRR